MTLAYPISYMVFIKGQSLKNKTCLEGIVESRMVHIVSDSGDQQCENVELLEAVLQLQHPDERVGHLRNAEAVEVVVERNGKIATIDGTDPVVEEVHVDVERRVETEFNEHPAH